MYAISGRSDLGSIAPQHWSAMWELNPHILLGRQSYYHYTNGACGVKPQTSHHRVRPDRMFSALNGPRRRQGRWTRGIAPSPWQFLLLLEIVLKKMSTSISQHSAKLHFLLQSTYSLSTYLMVGHLGLEPRIFALSERCTNRLC